MVKLVLIILSIVLLMVIIFLDQNSSPVPVKFILGNPVPIGLSTIMVVSVLTGLVLALSGSVIISIVRRIKNKRDRAIIRGESGAEMSVGFDRHKEW